jgi:hypothetical protein
MEVSDYLMIHIRCFLSYCSLTWIAHGFMVPEIPKKTHYLELVCPRLVSYIFEIQCFTSCFYLTSHSFAVSYGFDLCSWSYCNFGNTLKILDQKLAIDWYSFLTFNCSNHSRIPLSLISLSLSFSQMRYENWWLTNEVKWTFNSLASITKILVDKPQIDLEILSHHGNWLEIDLDSYVEDS